MGDRAGGALKKGLASVKRLVGTLIAGAAILTGLASCVEIPLTDSMLFQPPSRAVEGGARGFVNEDWLADRKFGPRAERPTVVHGTLPAAGRTIAWTEISIGAPGRPLVFHCMGNGADRYRYGAGYADKMLPFGDVFLWDYPGYGDTGGARDAAALLAVLPDVVAFARDRQQGRPLLIWGHSLGGQVCAEALAAVPDPLGYIGETTGPNIEVMADAVRPDWLGPLFRLRLQEDKVWLDAETALSRTRAPILILDAGDDEVLPGEIGRLLADGLEAAGHQDVTYKLLPGVSHNRIDDHPDFRPTIDAWLHRISG